MFLILVGMGSLTMPSLIDSSRSVRAGARVEGRQPGQRTNGPR